MNLEVDVIAITSTGVAAAMRGQVLEARFKTESVQKIRHDGFTYQNTLELAPGEYTVRFIVRDNLSGRIGSLSAPLKLVP